MLYFGVLIFQNLSFLHRREIEGQRSPIAGDLRQGKDLEEGLLEQDHGAPGEFSECLRLLEEEWSQLCDHAEVWRNQVDNVLANMRIFEKDLSTCETSLMEAEGAHSEWSRHRNSGGGGCGGRRRLMPEGLAHDREHLQRLSEQVSSLEQSLSDLREQAARLTSLSPATLIQLDKVEARCGIEQIDDTSSSKCTHCCNLFLQTFSPEGGPR